MDAQTIIRCIENLITDKAKDRAMKDTIEKFKNISTERLLKIITLEGGSVIDNNKIISRDVVKEYYDRQINKYRAEIENGLYIKSEKIIENILKKA